MRTSIDFFRPVRAEREHSNCQSLMIFVLAMLVGFPVLPDLAVAQNDECVPDPDDDSILVCSGDQSDGIGLTSNTVRKLQVGNLDDPGIQPESGIKGIGFSSTSGSDVILTSGSAETSVQITTDQASGIRLSSSGKAPAPQPNPVLGIPVPGDGAGGLVEVTSFSDITTDGNDAHGIHATSNTNGFDSSVIADLNAFIGDGAEDPNNGESNINFRVVSVAADDAQVSQQVAGVIIGDDGLPLAVNGDEIEGGLFTIYEDGSFEFDFGTAFDDLEIDEEAVTRISYEVELTSASSATGDRILAMGALDVTVSRVQTSDSEGNPVFDDNGDPVTELTIYRKEEKEEGGVEFEQRIEARFTDFGGSLKPIDEDDPTVFPDLLAYAERLRNDAEQGGAGNSVKVDSEGSITTSGSGSHGIFVQSDGAIGGRGRDATSGVLCIGSKQSTGGGTGKRGGNVTVTANGGITTGGVEAAGIVAVSLAGDGGHGGEGNACRYGSRGGTGGNGGDVEVRGSATIETEEEFASGILAVSQGGRGGNAGSGSWSTGGGAGGTGGKGGKVDVEGSWDITTQGDKAHGIWAKSVGGNAGAGGSAGWLGTASAGSGGRATDGGEVSVISSGTITTSGNDAYGIYAESIGGFGGPGGGGFGLFYSSAGDGSSAGSGGEVKVEMKAGGSVATSGERSHGIYAQSIGGGGGSGGGASGIAAGAGDGARGGNGGNVIVINGGTVETKNINSHGIYAQSIGGGGGDGGSAAGAVGIGGGGSSTSDGGTVEVTNTGVVSTKGPLSRAIFAQSIGGGGGDGGSSTGMVSIGGAGGGGGGSDTVTVSNFGELETQGDDSSAIFAQSVGGGGGNGGGSVAGGLFGSVAIGGRGGTGGDAADVVINTADGTIGTAGDRSHGIHAQSVGGGGGNGGYAVSAAVGKGISLAVAIGGPGGAGGSGENVTVDNGGKIVTQGKDAHGIFAQSVGGGGGSGGFSVAASVSTGVSVAVSLAGNGGAGSSGGDVKVTSTGDIETGVANRDQVAVHDLQGIEVEIIQRLADSGYSTIAELSLATEDDLAAIEGIDADAAADILFQARLQMQKGNHAYGILAQSIGGGGGDGGFSVAGALNVGGAAATFSMGGKGGAGGAGGDVILNSDSNITTLGDDSHAIVVQSVGGGGGSGGFSVSGGLSTGGAAAVSLGGSGGAGSIGGDVRVGLVETDGAFVAAPLTGNISTSGDHAYGILAQSVGGGGGDGGFSLAGTISKGTGAAFSMGGSGGTGGVSGQVDVITGAGISTIGRDAHGLVAQSIGGGGGSGGFSVAGGLSKASGIAASIGGTGGTGGDSSAVTVVNSGTIETGTGGQRDVPLDELEDLDPAILAILLDEGFETIADLADTPQSELEDIDGIDEDIANTLLEQANLFLQKDSHSYGIMAQSIGGGGGDGGFSVAGSFSKDGPGAAFSMGGSGGSGGDGDKVTVTNDGVITTRAENSYGILAQSVGGGGGSGGFSVAGQISLGNSKGGLAFSIGGAGAAGGASDVVSVTNTGDISTEGGNAHGIYALSVGGGGGAGGFSASGTISGSKSKQLGVSIGGFGGDGGAGNEVNVSNLGRITTLSKDANAIYAQSIGGGGGDGGMSFTGTFAGPEAKQLSASVGGFGGDGNSGGLVRVTNSGTLDTSGVSANGIQAQSVGGGGGNGGLSVSTGFAVTGPKKTSTFNGSISVGGWGGKGGTGGEVLVRNCMLDDADECAGGGEDVSITTRGDDAHGIYAQSIGGGGGDGGSTLAATVGVDPKGEGKSFSLAAAIGGFGGDGNKGGAVSVENQGLIDTLGNESHGIFAQSIGGGGGNGGSARTLQVVLGKKAKKPDDDQDNQDDQDDQSSQDDTKKKKERPKDGNKAMQVAVGGSGGSGGSGGDVTIKNSGDIVTRGADSHGVFGQSIGGGGGNGGNGAHGIPEIPPIDGNIDDALAKAKKKVEKKNKLGFKNSLEIVVGGNGGTGNDGGIVDIEHTGNIVTLYDGSIGVLAQSVGAGGGIGGNAALGLKGKFGLGGGGGASGDGGDVKVKVDGSIETVGTSAYGIFAQSVGGGGGVAGDVDFGIIDSKKVPILGETPALNIGVGLAVTRDGGSAGNGGNVTVDFDGRITTSGHAAIGILAQSIGGGGGLAGDTGFGLLNEIKDVLACSFVDGASGAGDAISQDCNAWVGSAGGDGSGGTIDINHSGTIETFGDVAHGIFAQSAGGAADDIQPMVVKLDDKGNVVTEPLLEDGQPVLDEDGQQVMVPVWEAASGPDVRDDLDDLGGNISITVEGDVLAHGAFSHGIFAHSDGDDGGGDITINILSGTVQGGTNTGVGVRFKGSGKNTLHNAGTITSADGAFGEAIFAGLGDETITNAGTISGSVDLGGGVNAFTNNFGATFNSGTTINLGSGNTLTNAGLVAPGGIGNIITSNLTGNFVHHDSGVLAVDIDAQSKQSDQLIVQGNADLAGTLSLNIMNSGWTVPGTGQVMILSSNGGMADSGISLVAPTSAVADYELVFLDGSSAGVNWNIDFAPVGLNGNGQAIGDYINNVQLAGGSEQLAPIVEMLYSQTDDEGLAQAYSLLNPQVAADNEITTLMSNMYFSDALLSCKVRAGEYHFVREGQCAWMRYQTRSTSRDDTSEYVGYDENAWQVAGGVQFDAGNDWTVGGALSIEMRDLDLNNGLARSDGRQIFGGLVIKRRSGPSIFSTSVTTGYADLENERLSIDGFTAESDHKSQFIAGQLRAEYAFDFSRSYLKPRIDLGVTHISHDGYRETGSSGANLLVAGSSDTHVYTQLALEGGFERTTSSGLIFRSNLSVGLTRMLNDVVPTTTAAFIAAPPEAGSFSVSSYLERQYVDAAFGLDIISNSDVVFNIGAFGRQSTDTTSYGGILKLSFPF